MFAPPTILRNASGAQSIGRAKEEVANRRGQGHYKGRSPVEPRPDWPKSPATGCPYPRVLCASPAEYAPEVARGIGAEYYVVLSRILQMDFGEFTFHALR
jgi:hypothetical protein